ncbi:MAG TPA: CoA transferase [Nocardioides sp.]|jgi:crotonobetainyl-CoA:carnitine CoA-transferase CaiB-like acyl-CoA transferase|uniref:CaiB/BaiF CoA transferase family protein n=1 Tax=Nocardioides sp. TaxID=35761 RepID=UPI002E38108C|nr:CoA transferase [Nocardioides sp.]HEX3930529.1 CoA transferase [Nocardioides sp.]
MPADVSTPYAGPLSGIRILDLTAFVLGPLTTRMLAQLGADVIKVEPPAGDLMRVAAPSPTPGLSSVFLALNHGKRSLVADLKRPEARDVVLRLLPTADIFVHNMSPRAITGLGLSADDVRAASPETIYCEITGFGKDGPYGGRLAYDDTMQAISGLAHLQGIVTGEPQYVKSAIADKTAATVAAYAILAALFERQRTGRVAILEVPMYETLVDYLMAEQMGSSAFVPPYGAERYPRMISEYRRPYRTSDGYLSVLPNTDRHWVAFFELIGRPELSGDPRFATGTARNLHLDDLYGLLEAELARRTSAEWTSALETAGIPHGPVKSLTDVVTDEHSEGVGLFETRQDVLGNTIRRVRSPLLFSFGELPDIAVAPVLGQHSREILAGAGYGEPEIDALIASHSIEQWSQDQPTVSDPL